MGTDPTAVSFEKYPVDGVVLVSSFADRDGEQVRAGIDLRGNEGLVGRPSSKEH